MPILTFMEKRLLHPTSKLKTFTLQNDFVEFSGFRIEFGSHDGLPMIIDFRMGTRDGQKFIALSHMNNGL